ncbi:hypothetical protein [Vibrio nomapromontoriensis]
MGIRRKRALVIEYGSDLFEESLVRLDESMKNAVQDLPAASISAVIV